MIWNLTFELQLVNTICGMSLIRKRLMRDILFLVMLWLLYVLHFEFLTTICYFYYFLVSTNYIVHS